MPKFQMSVIFLNDYQDELHYFFAVDNPELMAGVTSLSKLLNLPNHPDHFVLLQVISQ